MSAQVAVNQTERVSWRRLLWVGPLTIVLAVAVNLVLRIPLVAIIQPGPEVLPMQPSAIIFFTVIGVLLAIIAFAIVGAFSSTPVRTFRAVAIVALLISFIPDILPLISPAMGSAPGFTLPVALGLMFLHVVTAAVTVFMLTRFGVE